jgi:hypothetical protein
MGWGGTAPLIHNTGSRRTLYLRGKRVRHPTDTRTEGICDGVRKIRRKESLLQLPVDGLRSLGRLASILTL